MRIKVIFGILLCVLGYLIVVRLVIPLIFPISSVGHAPSTQRLSRIWQIGAALKEYSDNHQGQLPDSFAELVPSYIRYDRLYIFFPLEFDEDHQPRIIGSEQMESQLEKVFVYVRGKTSKVLAYERSGYWNIDSKFRAVLFTNFSASLWPSEKLDKQVKMESRMENERQRRHTGTSGAPPTDRKITQP